MRANAASVRATTPRSPPAGISAAESLRLISRPRPRILAARVGITVIALTRLNNTAAEIAMAMSRKSCPASS
jgi:hypothetical protein